MMYSSKKVYVSKLHLLIFMVFFIFIYLASSVGDGNKTLNSNIGDLRSPGHLLLHSSTQGLKSPYS